MGTVAVAMIVQLRMSQAENSDGLGAVQSLAYH
jgi:hypothetical protein